MLTFVNALPVPASDPLRACIITGSYGAGHDAAAEQIRQRLIQAGWRVKVVDIIDCYPGGLGRLLRWAYFGQLRLAPTSWRALLRILDADDAHPQDGGRRIRSLLGRLAAKRTRASIDPGTSVVISTHPFASQSLGYLRKRGRLQTLTVTYLTDASVHPLWVHESIDRHIAVHDEAAREARVRGARDVRVIRPLTPITAPARGTERALLRAKLGLPATARIALVSGGSEGVGTVRAAARDIRDSGVATPVVLCGHNERLRRQLEREPGLHALGWVNGLTDTIRGSDYLIQNSGGFTSLEALALGIPLISYRCLPGHGEASAHALLREGLAPWPKTPKTLRSTLETATVPDHLERLWSARESLLEIMPAASVVALAP